MGGQIVALYKKNVIHIHKYVSFSHILLKGRKKKEKGSKSKRK